MFMNIARCINAGEITSLIDGTFRVCQKEVCVYGIQEVILGGSMAPVWFSINQTESANAICSMYL